MFRGHLLPLCHESGVRAFLLRILRGHGVIRKLPGTHRYQVNAKGRQLIAAVLAANAASIAKLKQSA